MELLRPCLARLGFVALLGAFAGGCGSRAPAPLDLPPPRPLEDVSDCALIPDPGDPIATVALGEPVDPANAPSPTNDSERLLFRQVYETLVRIDCTGRTQPALAASWRIDADGSTWLVVLRDDARFSDGTPAGAADVLASWTDDAGELRPDVRRTVRSAAALDDRTLAVALHGQPLDAPALLADPALAVGRRVPDSPWPLGTRGLRLSPEQADPNASGGSIITLSRSDDTAPLESGGVPPIRFIVAPARDQRDLLDADADLLVTRDPAALDYAATLPRFQSVPLAWSRTVVFAARWRGPSASTLSPDARQALAREAVRGDARGAEGPFWWQEVSNCTVAPRPGETRAPETRRIVYETSDRAARDLAERLVGIAGSPGAGAPEVREALLPVLPTQAPQRAIGLSGDAWASALAGGADTGYLLSLDRAPIDRCLALQALTGRMSWLDPVTLVPLVDTRQQAIVRRGRSGLTVEWDGGLLLRGAGVGE